jgi:hypothetical protein
LTSALKGIKKLNRCKWFVAIFVIGLRIQAQQTYFQQEVNYKINVKLNDSANALKAFEEIQYINNSDKGLEYIYFHLWPNAYKNHQTALAKQLLKLGKSDLFYSDPGERGYIDSLDFKVNGKKVKIEYDPENIDICKLILNEPMRSLDTINISTPFFVKIPDAKFSRLGHTGQAYFITQWYPKPAVYDNNGWHPMPYLDQGEFFSEFGSFDVQITLPKNYLLAATGDRIDAEAEEDFLNENVGRTIERLERNDFRPDQMAFPPSSREMKTVRFRQFRVHDFAWFADKRFNVLHDQVELPNTRRTVDTWIFFTNRNFRLWKDAMGYVNESTLFYSYLVGDYPYNNITAVDGTIMAGGGMEYPNITVIGNSGSALELDITITHEVGHNWFYGILGSNERDFPFMDEGINSFYEMRYTRAKYPAAKITELLGKDSTFKLFGANKVPYWREKELAYFYSARAHSDQPISIASQDFTRLNYGSIVYSKTAVAFDYLMDYMGEDNFDKAMQFYFEQFKFRHPSTSDLAKTLSYFNGKSLDWFFKHLINSTDKIDYKIKKVKRLDDGSYNVKVKNKTNSVVPFNVAAFRKGKPAAFIWSDGFAGTKTIGIPAVDADLFRIDGFSRMPEINRKNNQIKTSGIFKRGRVLQLNFLTKLENPTKRQINFIPLIGANFYNGLMPGLCVHNYNLFEKKFEFTISPFFGLQSMTPAGFAEFNFNAYPKKAFRRISIGSKFKSFAYDNFNTSILNEYYNTNFSTLRLNYFKAAPFIQFDLKPKKANSGITQYINLTSNQLFVDSVDYNALNDYATRGAQKKTTYSMVNQLTYSFINNRTIDPFNFQAAVQQNNNMAKIYGELNYQVNVSKTHSMQFRIFAGSFIYGNADSKGLYSFKMDGYSGSYDYLFNYNYIARNEYNGLGRSQFTEVDGALKVPVSGLGNSTQWMAAVNFKSPKLFILPLRVFADAGVCDARFLNDEKILWDAGVNITLWKDIIDVYIPVSYSSDIKKVLDLNKVDMWNRIRFTLNLHKLAPRNWIKDNLF